MGLEVGQVLDGKYRIVRLIGSGGMGAVYEGENTLIQRRVAIKVLNPEASGNPELALRFQHEAQAAGRIGSDHILEILDVGALPTGDRYMVMEYLDGESLTSRIRRLGRLTPDDAVPIVCQLLAGLGAAHRASIVHRDLKPDNIYILKEKAGRRDFVKIIDFGISKFWTPTSELRMTRTGVVMGTAYYMSPEHAGGKEVDGRSDIYSAGVVLYEAVTGRVPFLATSYNELIIQIVTAAPKPAQEYVPDLPPPFCAIMDKALARDPAARFQTADEFAQALVDWVSAKSRGQTVNLGDVRNLFVGGIPVVTGPQPVSPLTPMPTGAPWANTGRESRAKSSAALVALGGAGVLIVVAVLAGAGWLFMHRGTTPAAAPPDSVAVVAAPPIVPRPVADVVDAAAEAAPAAEVVNAGAGGSMDGTGGRAGESGARAGGTGGRAATSGGPRPVAGPKCDPRIGYCPPAKRGAH